MLPDSVELVDTTCSICGAAVRGEKVAWRSHAEGKLDKETTRRVVKAVTAHSGGYICGTCGTVLCCREHKKEVENVGRLRGYWNSPCPKCGERLLDGFLLAEPAEAHQSTGEREHGSAPEGPHGAAPVFEPVAGGQPTVDPVASLSWKTEGVTDGRVVFPCPHCHERRTFEASLFENPPADGIDGFLRTKYTVANQVVATLLSLAVAVAVFVWVHTAMYGSQLTLGWPLIVPALAAVFGYSIIIRPLLFPVFANMPFISRKPMPVYAFTCDLCGGETHMACDGRRLALPVAVEVPSADR